jgi:hypothetical protein
MDKYIENIQQDLVALRISPLNLAPEWSAIIEQIIVRYKSIVGEKPMVPRGGMHLHGLRTLKS